MSLQYRGQSFTYIVIWWHKNGAANIGFNAEITTTKNLGSLRGSCNVYRANLNYK